MGAAEHRVRDLEARLLARHGPQAWWPARTRFEVVVGAVLTQNTAWRNVEQAIARLRAARALSSRAILAMSHESLAGLIRPAGTYRVKARRLHAVTRWLVDAGGFAALRRRSTPRLRSELLAVHGVGEETADAILLYALGRPVFVVDAYTRRTFRRLGGLPADGDDAIRVVVVRALDGDPGRLNEMHALLVAHGKETCRASPRCGQCRVAQICKGRA